MEIFIKAHLQGKSIKDAALEAGYAQSTSQGKIYQIMEIPKYKALQQKLTEMAQLDPKEIIGRAVSNMRMDLADVFPDDPHLKRARELGISQNIRKVRYGSMPIGYDDNGNPMFEARLIEVEVYSAQEARKMLVDIFGLKNLAAPNHKAQLEFKAAVDRLVQAAKDRGVTMSDCDLRQRIETRLLAAYQSEGSKNIQ